MAEAIRCISLEEFQKLSEEFLQTCKEQIQSQYVSEVEQLLQKSPYCYVEDIAKSAAHTIIVENLDIHVISLECDASDDEDDYDPVTEKKEEYQEILHAAVFLTSAPVDTKKMPLVNDQQARSIQLKNFCRIYPHLQQDRVYKKEVEVFNYEKLKDELNSFISEKAVMATLAVIVFNGHGNDRGLCFHDKGSEIKVDDFLNYVQDLLDKFRPIKGMPAKVEILLGQCYSHLHTSPETDYITVHSFTKKGREKTQVIFKTKFHPDSDKFDVVDANHVDLNSHAQELRKKEDELNAQSNNNKAEAFDEAPLGTRINETSTDDLAFTMTTMSVEK